ncbi:MAG: hypothetical protein GC181_13490 [Bacteroidetes bacterium]|nr:hypothetical protein [Bacteroidota bacterium]
MKCFKALLVVSLVGFAFGSVQAQSLSKVEKKKLKKEIKEYKKDPASYKNMKENNKREIDERDQTIEMLTKQIDELNAKNMALRDSIRSLIGRYEALMSRYNELGKVPDGTVYAVQIGYYQLLDLESFNGTAKYVKAEEANGAKRYVIGYFDNLKDAMQFDEDIKTLGINDAFVSQYVNGVRNMKFDAQKVKK